MQKTCLNCKNNFEITDEDLKFYEKVSPVFNGKMYLIPPPNLCPECREIRRLTWQNIIHLYQRKCDLTGKKIISSFSPDKKFKVYDSEVWWSDKFDALNYGREFDFSKPFFEQFAELMIDMPFLDLSRRPSSDENCDYTNYAISNKNCYLVFHANNNQDCLYGFGIKFCKDAIDTLNAFSSEILYECIDCENCYNLKFCQDCENCSESLFLHDCIGCKNCIACHGLQNAEYHVFNKKVTKEEFNKMFSEMNFTEWKKKFNEFKIKLPHRAIFAKQNEECSGDHIYRCKNVHDSFDIKDTRDAKFCTRVFNGPNFDLYDINQFGMQIENCYECSVVGINASNILFGIICREQINNLIYCIYSYFSQNCFGCIGIIRKKYCILNKQYTREEYEKLMPKIIEHMIKTAEWGEFFPAKVSPYGYNESIAYDHFPLKKEEAIKKGYNWSDYIPPKPQAQKTIKANQLPSSISDIPDDILNWAIECEITGILFKITQQELNFYKKYGIPIPHLHPNQRHADRMALRNPKKLFDRKCAKCGAAIKTSYSPERPEIVYCEACYLKEVY